MPDELRPLTGDESEALARHREKMDRVQKEGGYYEPAPFQVIDDERGRELIIDQEHASEGSGTLCGRPAEGVVVMRHLFSATDPSACRACADEASRRGHEVY